MDSPQIAQKGPYEYTAEKDGKIAWCACGLSKSQPMCDGSHKPTPFRPVIHDVKAGETYWFCGCKHTDSKPMCDGTHATL